MDRITCRESCKCHMAVSGQVRRGKRGLPRDGKRHMYVQAYRNSAFVRLAVPELLKSALVLVLVLVLVIIIFFFLLLLLFLFLFVFLFLIVVLAVIYSRPAVGFKKAPAAHNLYVVTKEELNANYKRLTSQLAQGVCLVGAWGWYCSWLNWNPSCLQYLGPPLFPRIVIRLVRKPLHSHPELQSFSASTFSLHVMGLRSASLIA